MTHHFLGVRPEMHPPLKERFVRQNIGSETAVERTALHELQAISDAKQSA